MALGLASLAMARNGEGVRESGQDGGVSGREWGEWKVWGGGERGRRERKGNGFLNLSPTPAALTPHQWGLKYVVQEGTPYKFTKMLDFTTYFQSIYMDYWTSTWVSHVGSWETPGAKMFHRVELNWSLELANSSLTQLHPQNRSNSLPRWTSTKLYNNQERGTNWCITFEPWLPWPTTRMSRPGSLKKGKAKILNSKHKKVYIVSYVLVKEESQAQQKSWQSS